MREEGKKTRMKDKQRGIRENRAAKVFVGFYKDSDTVVKPQKRKINLLQACPPNFMCS